MKIDIEKQKVFIEMLREGNILSSSEIRVVLCVAKPGEFVADIIKRTGLDIKSGMIGNTIAYFLANDVPQETAGLDEMFEATEEILTDTEEPVEYQDGHYIMWVCPNYIPRIIHGEYGAEGYDYCGQFHKVDLGDEKLTVPKTVQCVQCGQKHQIKPRGWK